MKKIEILLIVLMMVGIGFLTGCNEQEGISPIINSFTATPTIITLGNSSVLNWSVSGATKVSIDNGIGTIAFNGSYTVVPTINQTYILTAFNSYGNCSASVIVIVNPVASEKNTSLIVFTVEELWQKKDSYVDKNITVEGYYYISIDGPCLIPDTTVVVPDPDIKIILEETSLNLAKKTRDIIVNHKYHAEGVLKKVESSLGTNYYIILKNIYPV